MDPRKLLIIKPSSLGDVVHSLPLLNALKICFPTTPVHWVIARGLEGLLEGHPMIERLIVIDKDRWKRPTSAAATVGELMALRRTLRGERYEAVIDLQGLLRSGLIAAMTGCPLRIGFEEAREGSRRFYTQTVAGGRDVHAVERYMKTAVALGCDAQQIRFPFPEATVNLPHPEAAVVSGDFAVIVPGARWHTKVWPAERFGAVAARMPIPSVVVGGRSDADIAARVAAAAPGRVSSLAGKTDLKGLIAVMRRARIAVTNDSGPMHIAAAFGVPVVALFGPTSPERTGPYGPGHVVVRSVQKCAPCFRKKCTDLKCMRDITVDMVVQAVEGVLGRGTPHRGEDAWPVA